ncbi:MAG: UxaA family hydrolase [Halofilum sp. (in: g-proteobacteria)]|nr:UxaA family hydrolase [Halofilum sp. (in: g-proteobacteria)]
MSAPVSHLGTLHGFRRADGRVGIRNHVVVAAASVNMNPLVRQVAAAVPGVVPLPAGYGRGQLGDDLECTLRAMSGLLAHPNVGGALVISFEPATAARLAERVEARGRSIETLSFLELGGRTPALERACAAAGGLLEASAAEERVAFGPEELVVGLECGGSDTTSGLLGNPSLGRLADGLLEAGATLVFSEPVECIGGEALLEERAVSPDAAAGLRRAIDHYRDIALDQGIDLTGTNPTADNIAGGLTTIEEKSLGAIAKTGSGPIQGALDYARPPPGPGLWLMSAPAEATENLTALAAGGAQLAVFVTGSGNPVGHPSRRRSRSAPTRTRSPCWASTSTSISPTACGPVSTRRPAVGASVQPSPA